MFLHSGAAMHRHEFSAPLDASSLRNSIPRRSPLIRSAFSSPAPKTATTYDKPIPIIRPLPRPLSAEQIPHHNVRFRGLENTMSSEDGRSVSMSEASDATAENERSRKMSVTSRTLFCFAKAPPTALTEKLKVMPKTLLQIQRLSEDQRPQPVMQVLTMANFASRFMKKSSPLFRGSSKPGVNDVLVVRSEDYEEDNSTTREAPQADDEENREILAVICPMPKNEGGSKGRVEIAFNNGEVWVGTPLKNNSGYEFASTFAPVVPKLRWLANKYRTRSEASLGSERPGRIYFGFTILEPNVKDYPIIAKLKEDSDNCTKLYLPDSYEAMASSGPRKDASSGIEASNQTTTFQITDDLKLVIQITGIWVALRHGICPNFKCEDTFNSPSQANSRNSIGGRVTPDPTKPNSHATSPSSTHNSFGSVKKNLQRSFSKRSSPANTSPSQLDVPRRSVSLSNASVLMGREQAKRPPLLSTVTSDAEGEERMTPPKRAATEDITSTASPHRPRTLETPTKRRAVSAYITPSGPMDSSSSSRSLERRSVDGFDGAKVGVDVGVTAGKKHDRWTRIKNLFRREEKKTRSA